jgi:geranylgeranyl pyrophosphate synthase
MLESRSQQHAVELTKFMDQYFSGNEGVSSLGLQSASHRRLLESMRYSLLQEGGKRFRPVLAMLATEALGCSAKITLPFAVAVECVHTYSLIHDDLPAMDNDNFRRGKPTNHKAFDEATAILAGDGLLTEAFQIVASSYQARPAIAVELVAELARAAGFRGMVGGQAIDMGSKVEAINVDELRAMHKLKTGALIKVSAVGAAIACEANEKRRQEIAIFAETLGLAFQVADDLLDFDPARPELGSYPQLLGEQGTEQLLGELTETCLQCLNTWTEAAEPLRQIAIYNRQRKR